MTSLTVTPEIGLLKLFSKIGQASKYLFTRHEPMLVVVAQNLSLSHTFGTSARDRHTLNTSSTKLLSDI